MEKIWRVFGVDRRVIGAKFAAALQRRNFFCEFPPLSPQGGAGPANGAPGVGSDLSLGVVWRKGQYTSRHIKNYYYAVAVGHNTPGPQAVQFFAPGIFCDRGGFNQSIPGTKSVNLKFCLKGFRRKRSKTLGK